MKVLLAILLSFSAVSSFAQGLSEARKAIFEKSEACGDAVYSDNDWFAMSLPNTANGLGHFRVTSLTEVAKSWDFPADDKVVDIKIQNGKVYALTETTLEVWEITNYKKIFSHASSPSVSKASPWYDKATGFVLLGDKALITHSSLGLVLLNTVTGDFEKTIAMVTKSNAQDVALLNENQALVAVDNADSEAFRGLYVLDLNSFTVLKQIKIDNAMPLSLRILSNNRLLVGYISTIWKFDLAKSLANSSAVATVRTLAFPGLSDIDMRGKVFYDDKYMYSCFGIMNPLADGYYTRKPTPLTFSLRTLHLD